MEIVTKVPHVITYNPEVHRQSVIHCNHTNRYNLQFDLVTSTKREFSLQVFNVYTLQFATQRSFNIIFREIK